MGMVVMTIEESLVTPSQAHLLEFFWFMIAFFLLQASQESVTETFKAAREQVRARRENNSSYQQVFGILHTISLPIIGRTGLTELTLIEIYCTISILN